MRHSAEKRSFFDDGGVEEVFAIQTVVKAVGGVSPCFLYRGRRVQRTLPSSKRRNFGPAGRHAQGALVRGGAEEEEPEQIVPDCSGCQEAPGLLTLYISFEEASPSPKLRMAATGGAGALAAPFRVCLRDSSDDLLVSYRGLPAQVYTDERLGVARWGPLRIGFPSPQDLRHFASCLRRVEVVEWDLRPGASEPPAAAGAAGGGGGSASPPPRPVPPPPAAWGVLGPRQGSYAAQVDHLELTAATASALSPPDIPAHGGSGGGPLAPPSLQRRQPAPEEGLPCTPPAQGWALAAASDLPPLVTPPPLNRCAQSGGRGVCRRLLAGPPPAPVPFGLPLPQPVVGQPAAELPISAVAAAIALLEAGLEGGAW